MKEHLDLPQGQGRKTPGIKEHLELPEGGRAKDVQIKEHLDLPQGGTQKNIQIKEHLDLPQGSRERTVSIKEHIELPSGSREKSPALREQINLPSGGRENPGPTLKEEIDLPPQSDHEILTGGILGLAEPLSPASRRLGFLSSVKNLIRAERTAASTRPGRESIGQVGSTPVLGLGAWYHTDGTKKLISGSGTVWKAWDGTSWSDIETGLTSGEKIETTNYDDLLLITNGADPVKVYNGSNVTDLGGDPPVSPFILQAYRRLFLIETPFLLRCSDIADTEEWLEPDSATIPINAKDGDVITWMQQYKTNIYIWKRHALFELHGPELGYVTKNWRVFNAAKVGTPNGRTVQEIEGTLFWLSDSKNSKGVVAWTGGRPEVVSEPINGLIDKINWDYISTANAGTDGNGNYLLSVPLDEEEKPESTIVFNTRDGSWWFWEGWTPTVYGQYRVSTDKEMYLMGDDNGYVYTIGGDDDAGTDIAWEAIIGPAILGSPTQEKRVRRAYIILAGGEKETFTLDLGGATGGTFTLGEGETSTSDIAHDASASTIETALETVYGAGNVGVATGSDFIITFDTDVGASNLEADFTSLEGATNPALTQECQQVQAATSAYDVGAFDDTVDIDLTNTRTNRIKKYLPLNTGEDMGGYAYRLKLTGEGLTTIHESGFEVGVRRV